MARPARSRPAPKGPPLEAFLPTTRAEMEARGWDELDILIVSGDAYVDHPAFGPVLIARVLEAQGYRVGFIAQPRWDTPDDVLRMGRPRLFVGVSAGNLDSMLNKLTAQRKVRSEDQYSPGGRTNARPNRASVVYGNLLRGAMPGVPIVLGGIEASLRRIAHYDYWSENIRRSVLLDSKADLLVFGMGEHPILEIAELLASGRAIDSIRHVRGTAFVMNKGEWEELETSRYIKDGKPLRLPSYEEVKDDLEAFSRMSGMFQRETNPGNARPLLQPHGKQAVYFNPPAEPLATPEMDHLYALPFARAPHPSYDAPHPGLRDRQALHRHHARLLRRLLLLLHHRARGPRHPEPLRRERAARGPRPAADAWLLGRHLRRRRPDGEYVPDEVPLGAHREELPTPQLRAPGRL